MTDKSIKQTLKFKFDISAYRLLGRELITDRVTALFELVKNAYDANSEKVSVEFISVNPLNNKSKIIIKDDGIGMSFDDIKEKWMVIGTSSKRRNRLSPAPFNRKVIGKKGVGRFAVDKLGAKLLLKTKQEQSDKVIFLETDWSKYSDLEEKQLKLEFPEENGQKYFTDIENKYWFEKQNDNTQGTTLEITLVNDVWTENDIIRAYKELAKLISPNFKQKFPFNITIKSQYEQYKNKKVESLAIHFATEEIHLNFNLEQKTQEIIKAENGVLKIINVKERPCGLLKFKLYYFNQNAKDKFRKAYPDDRIDGIKVYRDGILTTPFAEYVDDPNKKKDLLGIDKRRWSGFFDRLSNRDLFGYVEITDEYNPDIIEATNRQGFVDNEAWEELTRFVIEQVNQLENVIKQRREVKRTETKTKLGGASEEIKSFRKEINEVKKKAVTPEVKKVLEDIGKRAGKIQATVNKGIKDYQDLEKETKQKENLFFSLVSLQTYASMLSHMTSLTFQHIISDAEYLSDYFPDPKKEQRFLHISKKIFSQMLKLKNGVDFMLKYAKTDIDIEELNLKDLIENLIFNIYKHILKKESIRVLVEIDKDLIIRYNKKVFEDIFENLISNSIKALKNTKNKLIKITGEVGKDKFILLFSDNGFGIPEKDKYRVFDIFYTTTAEQGGAGIGLYAVKTRIEAMKGEIRLIENELKPTGTTLKIILPYKK